MLCTAAENAKVTVEVLSAGDDVEDEEKEKEQETVVH